MQTHPPVQARAHHGSGASPGHEEARRTTRPRASAFSLIELLVAVSIMLVIIYALYAMFNQTQKALRANITQVDVLESGRAAAEMIGRELEQLTACHLAGTINLYAGMVPIPPLTQMDLDQNPSQPPLRTNVLQEFFFLSRETNQWIGTGYRVMQADHGVGTLFRFSVATNYYGLTFTNLMGQFVHAALATDARTGQTSTNFNRVAEGIIHLRVTAYDPEGRRLGWESTNVFPGYRILRRNRSGATIGLNSTAFNVDDANVILQQPLASTASGDCLLSFVSNAVPGYVEVELGVLEPATLQQFKALQDSPNAAASFLKRQTARVHLFRQRIPIRTGQQ